MPRQIKNKTKPWNKIHIDRFNWLYNYMEANYENISKDDFIDINKRFLIEFIEENKSWSDSSKESFYFMIARYLYNKNNNDRYSKIYSEKGFQLMQKTKIITEKNELDDKEKEKIQTVCECGGHYRHSCKSKHHKTTKHIKYLESIIV